MANIEVNLYVNGCARESIPVDFDKAYTCQKAIACDNCTWEKRPVNEKATSGINGIEELNPRRANEYDDQHSLQELNEATLLVSFYWNDDLLCWEAESEDLLGINLQGDNLDVLISRLHKIVTSDYNIKPGTNLLIKAIRDLEL